MPDTDEIKNGVIDNYKERAPVTSLCVSDFAYKEYVEPKTGAISMTRVPSAEALVPDDGRQAMISIISKKPV